MSGKHPTQVTQRSTTAGEGGTTHTTVTIQKENGVDVRTMTTSSDGFHTRLNDSTVFTGDSAQQQAAVEHGRRASGAR